MRKNPKKQKTNAIDNTNLIATKNTNGEILFQSLPQDTFLPDNNNTNHTSSVNNLTQNYQRNVIEDNDSVYSVFGVTRGADNKEGGALQLLRLNENIWPFAFIIQPSIREALNSDEFTDYLNEIHFRLSTDTSLDEYAKHPYLIKHYLNYEIRDKKINGNCPHPSVLQMLAHVKNIDLRLWTLDDKNQLVPYSNSVKTPENTQKRIDLLFTDNHYEKIKFPEHGNGTQNDNKLAYPSNAAGNHNNNVISATNKTAEDTPHDYALSPHVLDQSSDLLNTTVENISDDDVEFIASQNNNNSSTSTTTKNTKSIFQINLTPNLMPENPPVEKHNNAPTQHTLQLTNMRKKILKFHEPLLKQLQLQLQQQNNTPASSSSADKEMTTEERYQQFVIESMGILRKTSIPEPQLRLRTSTNNTINLVESDSGNPTPAERQLKRARKKPTAQQSGQNGGVQENLSSKSSPRLMPPPSSKPTRKTNQPLHNHISEQRIREEEAATFLNSFNNTKNLSSPNPALFSIRINSTTTHITPQPANPNAPLNQEEDLAVRLANLKN